jgi:peroxiredoxin
MATWSKKQSKKLIQILAPFLVLAALISGALYSIKAQFPNHEHAQPTVDIRRNQTLPDIQLTQLNGHALHLSDFNAKILMITFWASWCEACMSEMPSLVKLRQTFYEKGFEILGVNLDENPESVAPQMIKQFNIQFPILKDENNIVSELFDVRAIPLTIVLDRSRRIIKIVDGEQNWNSPSIHKQMTQWLSE